MKKEIELLKTKGYEVHEFTPYQFRINRTLDLYPVRRKFHNLETHERGVYPLAEREFLEFIEKQLAALRPSNLPEGRYYNGETDAPWWAKVSKK